MTPLGILVACAGNWQGTNILQDPNTGSSEESPSTAVITPVLDGEFARVDYLELSGGTTKGIVGAQDGLTYEEGVGSGSRESAGFQTSGGRDPCALDGLLAYGRKGHGVPGDEFGWTDDQAGWVVDATGRARLGMAD